MGLVNFFRGFFKSADMVDISTWRIPGTDAERISVEAYALFSAVEMAANLVANCEFKTFINGKEVKGAEWTSLNYRPNRNQCATEFWREFFCKLLYEGEALIIQNGTELIIADSFYREDYATKEQIFKQVTRGDFTFNKTFKMSDVCYCRYQNQQAQALKNGLLAKYSELSGVAADNYIQSGGQKGTLEISALAKSDKDFEERFTDLMNNRFKTYFKNRNAVIPIFNGMKYTPQTTKTNSGTEIADIAKIYDDALMRAAQAYMISPALVKGDIAGIKDALNLTLTVCTDPLANIISEELTIKKHTPLEIGAGNFIKADTSNIKHIDIFDIASSVDKLISSGFENIDEVRVAAGLEPTGEDWAQKHYLTKNYEDINALALKGGENNE